jgi:hypothetical protein
MALLRSQQSEWQQRYQHQHIGLFGSTARNEATASNDLDVWVELDPLTPFASATEAGTGGAAATARRSGAPAGESRPLEHRGSKR